MRCAQSSENASAGIYTEGPQEYVLQAVGRVRTRRGHRRERRRDARRRDPCSCATSPTCRKGAALKRGEGSRNGKPAVIVGVQKQPGANTIEVTDRLDRELDALQAGPAEGHHASIGASSGNPISSRWR